MLKREKGAFVVECPRCHQSQPEGRATCNACGVIFARWEEHQRRAAERQVRGVASVQARGNVLATAPPLNGRELVLDQSGFRAGVMLLLGFAWPLYKASLLAADSLLIWPWSLIHPPESPLMATALATPSGQEAFLSWMLVALGAGGGAVLLPYVSVSFVRAALMTGVGSVALVLLLVVYYQEAEILGLAFTPPTRGAGVVLLVLLLGCALIAVSNRLRKVYGAVTDLRVMAGIGGSLVGLLVVLAVVSSEGPWGAWSMILLYLLLGGQALLALYGAATHDTGEWVTVVISRLMRCSIVWSFFAVVIAQATVSDPYSQYVIQAGGGLLNTLLSVTKGFLMYFGSAYLMTLGFVGVTTLFLARYTEKKGMADSY